MILHSLQSLKPPREKRKNTKKFSNLSHHIVVAELPEKPQPLFTISSKISPRIPWKIPAFLLRLFQRKKLICSHYRREGGAPVLKQNIENPRRTQHVHGISSVLWEKLSRLPAFTNLLSFFQTAIHGQLEIILPIVFFQYLKEKSRTLLNLRN